MLIRGRKFSIGLSVILCSAMCLGSTSIVSADVLEEEQVLCEEEQVLCEEDEMITEEETALVEEKVIVEDCNDTFEIPEDKKNEILESIDIKTTTTGSKWGRIEATANACGQDISSLIIWLYKDEGGAYEDAKEDEYTRLAIKLVNDNGTFKYNNFWYANPAGDMDKIGTFKIYNIFATNGEGENEKANRIAGVNDGTLTAKLSSYALTMTADDNDTEAPVVTNISIDKTEVKAGDEVRITLTVSDSKSGLKGFMVEFSKKDVDWGIFNSGFENASDNTMTAVLKIPDYIPEMELEIHYLNVYDYAGNFVGYARYNAEKRGHNPLTDAMKAVSLKVNAGPVSDIEGPEVLVNGVPESVKAPGKIDIKVTSKDKLTNVQRVDVEYYNRGGSIHGWLDEDGVNDFKRISASEWTGSLSITNKFPTGVYTLYVVGTDQVGNTTGKAITFRVENPDIPEVLKSDSKKDAASYEVTDQKKNEVEYSANTDNKQKSVKIPDSITVDGKKFKVTSISDNAFKGNKTITTVTIGKNVKEIGNNAFSGCTSLKNVTIPANTTEIGKGAFNGCKKLTTVTLGKNVKEIGDNAFSGCTSLKKVTIPTNTTEIGKGAFSGCNKLTTVTLGKNVKEIGDNSFKNCAALKSVTLPSKANKIGDNAFAGCKKLTSIKITSTKLTSKTIDAKAFKGVPASAKITVPKSKLSAYKKLFKKKGLSNKVKIVGK